MIKRNEIDEIISKGNSLPWSRIEARLESEDLSVFEFASIIMDSDPEHLEALARAAMRIRAKRFGKAIKIYAPLYISNSCTNNCLYCGFNRENEIERTTLSTDEIEREAQVLIEQGHRHILLVSGEDANAVPVDFIKYIAQVLRPRVASLSIEVGPLEQDEYVRLGRAGVDGVTLYQETYDRENYRLYHRYGAKADFDKRLWHMEQAGKAGMRFLGIGALLGLADWRREAIALCLHARYLQKTFWKSSITVSTPRIKFAPKGFRVPHPVSDTELTRFILALRCALPDAGIILSTREPADLRNNLVPLGITQVSAGSRTDPGGYSTDRNAGTQFSVEDPRTPEEVAESLKSAGFDPVFKDWESCLHGG